MIVFLTIFGELFSFFVCMNLRQQQKACVTIGHILSSLFIRAVFPFVVIGRLSGYLLWRDFAHHLPFATRLLIVVCCGCWVSTYAISWARSCRQSPVLHGCVAAVHDDTLCCPVPAITMPPPRANTQLCTTVECSLAWPLSASYARARSATKPLRGRINNAGIECQQRLCTCADSSISNVASSSIGWLISMSL